MSQLVRGLSTEDLRRLADRLPRIPLAHLPTPLEAAPRFSEAVGGPPIYIKRDDCTGLALGGNKTRHNEFILADALEQGADVLVWGAGVQSNNCRQTAAACAKLGLECRLILSREAHGDEVQGNLLLDYLVGAQVQIVDAPIGPELDAVILAEADRLRAAGRKPYYFNRGPTRRQAAVSYALCLAELADQLRQRKLEPAAVYICSASATGAGLVLGAAALGLDWSIRNVLPIRWPWDEAEDMARIANETAELLGLEVRLRPGDVEVVTDQVGEGYGIPTPGGMEALRLLARTEGILLDPVYTAKAMAALVADLRSGRVAADQPVVFVHTGGAPALFAYRDELLKDAVDEST
jgi:1-aminocyclopropane-1-carboxylate deaminase/D-cysteine desulfhydrase-like pyridoxal-dependent ACC family enzyme